SLAADFVNQVSIMKTPDPTLTSGAIGATINVILPKPFDRPGLHASASVSGAENPDEGDIRPTYSALISDTFANDTVGVLVDFDHAEHSARTTHVNIQGWVGVPDRTTTASPRADGSHSFDTLAAGQSTAGPAWFIQDYGIYQEHNLDTREDGRA